MCLCASVTIISHLFSSVTVIRCVCFSLYLPYIYRHQMSYVGGIAGGDKYVCGDMFFKIAGESRLYDNLEMAEKVHTVLSVAIHRLSINVWTCYCRQLIMNSRVTPPFMH